MVEGLKVARRILAAKSFETTMGKELMPGAEVTTDDALREYVRQNVTTIFHPTGTCKMGPAADPTAVVDASLRVHGVEGLRVVDCSVMPSIVSGNTNVPAVAIGEKAADMIERDYAAVQS